MTALLEYSDLFALDLLNVFQHDYCTSNLDLQNIRAKAPPSEQHPCSYINETIAIFHGE